MTENAISLGDMTKDVSKVLLGRLRKREKKGSLSKDAFPLNFG